MLDKILTCNDHKGDYRRYVQGALVAQLGRSAPKVPWGVIDGLPVSAWVYQGFWVASCECGGNLYYEPDQPYFCPDCLNAANKHVCRPVVMPVERVAIETALVMRPNRQNRNWLVGESVENLLGENILYGVMGGLLP